MREYKKVLAVICSDGALSVGDEKTIKSIVTFRGCIKCLSTSG